jgi:hypothetical protein
MTDRVSNVELARQFYDYHALSFQRAVQRDKPGDRFFEFSNSEFDDWAVGAGHMTRSARNAGDEIERRGLTQQRYQLRDRMNRAARKGDGVVRAFSVEARGGKWRVNLSEAYVLQKPGSIITGIRSTLSYSERQIEHTRKLVQQNDFLTDEDRMVLYANLGMAQMFIFNSIQTVELVAMTASSGEKPDLRRLRRRMAIALNDEITGVRRKRIAVAKKKA